ncbi:hypothetical protein AB2M62_10680 [Sphingomonas sp. MMS12-HWE2-04]|uniref:hypothetical protein n=1 Tax=Sphingomonas sp. MMS12-HWE2-04 TaxID=3234199 RepID=UPI00384A87F2
MAVIEVDERVGIALDVLRRVERGADADHDDRIAIFCAIVRRRVAGGRALLRLRSAIRRGLRLRRAG